MMIESRKFGATKNGEEVLCFTLRDGDISAEILNYGGVIRSLTVPSRDGKPVDVVLGFDSVSGYENDSGHLGALIGRFANRIRSGKFMLDGKEYVLFQNDRTNTLHGGKEGFDRKIWSASVEDGALMLRYFSPNLEENFPGNLMCEVRYSLQNNGLVIAYSASSDAKTPINLTNHTYFNLGGEDSGDILGHRLRLLAENYLEIDEMLLPLAVHPVAGTPFDFRVFKPIGSEIGADNKQLEFGHGYDHNFCLDNSGNLSLFAEAVCPETGIRMEGYTDLPGVQFYSGNFLDADGKTAHYSKRSGFCLETQYYPDSVNHPEFPSTIFDDGEPYESTTVYRFSVVE